VDLVHWSMVDRAKGLCPNLIWAVPLRSSGQGSPQVVCGGRDRVPGGARRGRRRSSLDLELWASVWDAARLYVELGGR
jgi:hypothetical protein